MDSKDGTNRPVIFLTIVLAFILVALALNALYVFHHFHKVAEGDEFGDMFGGAGALFSGLAFAGVMYTLILQSRELRDHRKEFEQNLQLSAAVALFDYCNKKISSLRNGVCREKKRNPPNTEKIAEMETKIQKLLETHKNLKTDLERMNSAAANL